MGEHDCRCQTLDSPVPMAEAGWSSQFDKLEALLAAG